MLECLLKEGADIDLKDNQDQKPQQHAKLYGHADVFEAAINANIAYTIINMSFDERKKALENMADSKRKLVEDTMDVRQSLRFSLRATSSTNFD